MEYLDKILLPPSSESERRFYFGRKVVWYGNATVLARIYAKELGYGKGYEKYTKDDLLLEKLKGRKYLK